VPPRLLRIRSANAEFQLAQALLHNRRQRQRQGRFAVEGVRPISEAVAHGWTVDSLWYAAGRPLSDWALGLLERGIARRHVELAPALMNELSGKEDTSELIAFVEMRPDELDRIPRRPDGLLVCFDRPVGPGNLGSVIRSTDALGGHGVVVTGHAADIYDPQAIRASTGSLFALPVVREGSLDAVRAWLSSLRAEIPGLQVLGSSAGAKTPVSATDLTCPSVLAVGNETNGLSRGWREVCDELVLIPMAGAADSLNAAAAASILLYEAARQRAAERCATSRGNLPVPPDPLHQSASRTPPDGGA
jgi:23S rRNA (uridine2479-2'-O)-methyltransferase